MDVKNWEFQDTFLMKKTNEGKKYVQVQDNIWEITSTILSTKDHCVLAASCRALMFLLLAVFLSHKPIYWALKDSYYLNYLKYILQYIFLML